MHGSIARCHALTAEGLAAVIRRARERDRMEFFALTGAPLLHAPDALAAAMVAEARWGATVHDAEGAPQAAVGISPGAVPGLWGAWVHATEAWPEVWRPTLRWCREVLMPALLACPDVRRVQALVVADEPRAVRFLDALGFVREGVLRRFGMGGEDVTMMARAR